MLQVIAHRVDLRLLQAAVGHVLPHGALGAAVGAAVAAAFHRRRDIALRALAGRQAVRLSPPQGAMYVMVDVRATGLSGRDFADRLLDEAHIAVMPGESFGTAAAGHLRIALTVADADLATALGRIADLAEREGRAVVVAVNKWDVEPEKQQKLRELREAFERLLPQLRGAPLVTVSAKTGKGLDRLRAAVEKAHEVWNRRITTAQLNRWLVGMLEQHPPPAPGGRRIKLRYMTQAKTRPPGFVVMCSHPDKLPESYTRYLVNGLREDFDMLGTPVRLYMRSQSDKNPYKAKKKPGPSSLRKHISGRSSK